MGIVLLIKCTIILIRIHKIPIQTHMITYRGCLPIESFISDKHLGYGVDPVKGEELVGCKSYECSQLHFENAHRVIQCL